MGHAGVVARTAEAARIAASFEKLGNRVAEELGSVVPLDRLNIGLIDPEDYIFTDAFVTGRNVQGRTIGHRRTLTDTVVEAGMKAGGGIVIGDEPPERLAERFPRLQSTLDTGIRSMLTVTLESEGKTVAALVLASIRPSAYTNDDLDWCAASAPPSSTASSPSETTPSCCEPTLPLTVQPCDSPPRRLAMLRGVRSKRVSWPSKKALQFVYHQGKKARIAGGGIAGDMRRHEDIIHVDDLAAAIRLVGLEDVRVEDVQAGDNVPRFSRATRASDLMTLPRETFTSTDPERIKSSSR